MSGVSRLRSVIFSKTTNANDNFAHEDYALAACSFGVGHLPSNRKVAILIERE